MEGIAVFILSFRGAHDFGGAEVVSFVTASESVSAFARVAGLKPGCINRGAFPARPGSVASGVELGRRR